jgi:transcriptional regulator with GAF, ATPase, and Fis domain
MFKFALKSTWKTAFVAAAASALVLLLVQAADHLPGQRDSLSEALLGIAWFAVLGNALFVFWMVHRLAAPMRNLVDQARAKGLAPEQARTSPISTLRPHEDELGEMADICKRITQALSVLEARQLFPEIVCGSQAMLQVLTVIERVAHTDTTVLIQGESGTGKELVARSIHRRSSRQDRPFVPINCAAIPASLLESELFGHEKGAFTGALQRRVGRFEIAEGGTVFLDEIGEMPPDMQAKLLRVLQERVVTPVGGNRTVPVDVRIVAATNQNLEAMVAADTFRQDLFFRLSVLPLRLPPLRERPGDIPILVQAFLHRFRRPDTQISPEAIRFLVAHSWPGNVRELENAIEAALVIAGDTIRPEHLPPRIAPDPGRPPPLPDIPKSPPAIASPTVHESSAPADTNLDDTLAAIERKCILDALDQAKGVQVEAARILGIKERSLWHRIKKYDIDPAIFRHPGD